ncbi:MaoC family dehydratase [Shinella sp. BYT-45]|uniref:MaoC family dehydratase n=1 Tax=Shinella sp. BYT-45 TaxID=3377377 RepID=UPI00397FEDD6
MQFPIIEKTITLEKMRAYTGMHNRNIHTDPEMATGFGLGGAVAQGSQLTTILNELMVRTFGKDYWDGGSISVSYIKMVRPGDTVTPHAKVVEARELPDGRTAIDLKVWIENQAGETTTAGTAKVTTHRSAAA